MKSAPPQEGTIRLRQRLPVTPLGLALASSVLFTATCNNRLWAVLAAQPATSPLGHWWFMTASFVLIASLQFILLSLLVTRWTAKPVVATIIVLTAATTYFVQAFGIYMDVPMLQNILHTDREEALDLLAWRMLPHAALYAALPLLLLWRTHIIALPLRQSWHHRPLGIMAALLLAAGSLAGISQQFIPLMREHKEIRHLVTPSNYLVSLVRAVSRQSHTMSARKKTVIGADATVSARSPTPHKPALLVIVVGETVRAANWGLNGYARQTTPELAKAGVINFPDVSSCGTNTETSLPCMFSPQGRRHYDEATILGSESLLDVLHHAGLRVLWRDNQSGCKGVCDGVESSGAPFISHNPLCNDDGCPDEALLAGLADEIRKSTGDTVVVLHQMGNHGPAYYQRYPDAYRRFTPTCDTNDLGQCSQQQIINSYDNAVLYTDHVLRLTVDLLKQQSADRETAMIYLSDHGESLGEHGLFLHSLPYAIAPATQTHVPMVMWISNDFGNDRGISRDCLVRQALLPASHDNLFHTVLGLLDIRTRVYDRDMDLTAPCRAAGTATPAGGDAHRG